MPENGLSERFDRIEKRVDALSADMTARFGKVDERFEQVDKRFNQIDERFKEIDKQFDGVKKQFHEVQEHFVGQREYTELAYTQLDRRMTAGFSRLERKINQVIDAQSRPKAPIRRQSRPSKRRR
jgi:hypothetical protein